MYILKLHGKWSVATTSERWIAVELAGLFNKQYEQSAAFMTVETRTGRPCKPIKVLPPGYGGKPQ